MASDQDITLAEDRGGGLTLDDDWAQSIPLVGFEGDDSGVGDIAFIGFDEAAPSRAVRRWLGDPLRRAAAAARLFSVELFWWLRFRLTPTHLTVRRLRAAIVPLIALLVAVGIGLGLRVWLPARQPAPVVKAAPVGGPGKSVLVASQAIARGRILRPSDLQWRPWPPADIKQSYVVMGTRHRPDLAGQVARAPIAAGQPVSTGDVVAPADRGFMAAMLKPGMRAVSIAIGPETAASGLILPGDEVDVLLSMPVPAFDANGDISPEERASVQTLLWKVPVLAIDQETDGRPGRAIVGHAATLEVTPKEAEIITLANELAARSGMLVLTLRSMRGEAAQADGAAAPHRMLDTDISKFLTDRPVARPLSRPLTIVRRGTRSQP